MKKLWILIIFTFFLTGCYDYREINDLSFVSAIGIDYEDEKYKLTFEIINDTKQGENKGNKDAYTLSASGTSLSSAFDNMSLKVTKIPFYYHLEAMVISKDIAKDHMSNLVDFIVRNPLIRNEFYLVISDDTAKDIITASNESNPVVGSQIATMINTNSYQYNIIFKKPFEDIFERLLNDNIDALVTTVKTSGDSISLDGISLFEDYKYKTSLDALKSAYLNTLMEKNINVLISKKYDDKLFSVNLFASNADFEFKNDKIVINVSLQGEVSENNPDFDLRDEDIYNSLNKDFSLLVQDKITEVIKILQENNVDPLGLKDKYYKKYRKEIKNIYDIYDIEVNADVIINKKGLIFEVGNE